MLTRKSIKLPTIASAIPEKGGQDLQAEVVELRKQINALRKEHYEFMRAVKEYQDGLNSPDILNITQAKIQNCTLDNTSVGATTASTGVFTTVNKVTITAPATGSTLTIADGKTFSALKTLALDGTDSTTMTFPTTSATVARTDAAQTFTGTQTFSGAVATGSVAANNQLTVSKTDANTFGSGTFWNNTFSGITVFNPSSTANAVTGIAFYGGASSNSVAGVAAVQSTANSLMDLAFCTGGSGAGSSVPERLRITSDGRLYGTALHNNAGAVTGTTNQYIASGTYTPVLTNVANVAASTMRATQWIRIGNVVHVAGLMDIDPTAVAVTSFRITLPIASNLASAFQLGGVGAYFAAAAPDCVTIYGDTVNDAAIFAFSAVGGAANSQLSFSLSYLVV